MDYKIPKTVHEVIDKLTSNGFDAYIVGGAVRDMITGRNTYDWDLTTNATPEKLLKIIPDSYYTNDYGTVGVKPEIEGERPIEVTTYRSEEGYSDFRHPDKVVWGKTIESDLERRDFTINAIAIRYQDNKSPEIFDPFKGQKDLDNKIIRAVGDPNERFREDALRMMRAIRIASQLGFMIEDKTLEAIQANAPLIHKIARERVRDELLKLLASSYPYDGLLLLKNSGIMEEILPELFKTFGVEQKSPNRHHIYDVGTHLMMSLKHCSSTDPITRFATLIHDIGKPQTMRVQENGVITFYNHEMASTKIAQNIADRLKLSNEQTDKLTRLVRWHQFTVSEHQTDSAIRRFIVNVTPKYIDDMIALRTADRLGSGAKMTSWRTEEFKKRIIEVQKQPFAIKDLKINGNDVMKTLRLSPSPKVGEILENIFEKVVSKELPNEKEVLLEALKSFL